MFGSILCLCLLCSLSHGLAFRCLSLTIWAYLAKISVYKTNVDVLVGTLTPTHGLCSCLPSDVGRPQYYSRIEK